MAYEEAKALGTISVSSSTNFQPKSNPLIRKLEMI